MISLYKGGDKGPGGALFSTGAWILNLAAARSALPPLIENTIRPNWMRHQSDIVTAIGTSKHIFRCQDYVLKPHDLRRPPLVLGLAYVLFYFIS